MGYGQWAALGCAAALGWMAHGAQEVLEPLSAPAATQALEKSEELSAFFTRHEKALGRLESLQCEPNTGDQAPYWKCRAREAGSGSSGWAPFAGARDTRVAAFSFEVWREGGKVRVLTNASKEIVGFKSAAGVIAELARRVDEEQAELNPPESAQRSVERRRLEWERAGEETLETVARPKA